MKKTITVQVTFNAYVDVDIPDEKDTEVTIYELGLDIAGTLRDELTSAGLPTTRGKTIYWDKTHTEIMDECDFVGDTYYF